MLLDFMTTCKIFSLPSALFDTLTDNGLTQSVIGGRQNGHSSPKAGWPPSFDIDDTQLARVLVETLLPSMANKINLQALLVYQADNSCNRSFMVNRCFQRHEEGGVISPYDPLEMEATAGSELQVKRQRVCGGKTSSPSITTPDPQEPIQQPGTPCDSASQANIKPEDHVPSGCLLPSASTSAATVSSSRRKRKFCRPCRIPQVEEPLPTPEPTVGTEPKEEKRKEVVVPKESPTLPPQPPQEQQTPPAVVPQRPQPPVQHPLTVTAIDCLNSTILTALSRSLFSKPESKATLFPQVSLKPMTTAVGLSSTTTTTTPTVPRPIRPRILPANSLSTTTPQTSNTFTATTAIAAATSNNTVLSATVGVPESNAPTAVDATESDEAWAASRRYAKSFVCNQCRFVFGSLNALCEHTYSLHKAFRCNYCQAQFTQRSNLQRHSLRHVGFKPFVCAVCSKEYYRKDHLVRHIEITHAGSDPKSSIIVKLSSAECLDYLESLAEQSQHPHEPGKTTGPELQLPETSSAVTTVEQT
uniref:Zinc finger protein 888 n=2 Tax=Schistocephalus solidus TaxID=70667 RepID=A0A0X3PDH0_SCHSO